MSKEWCEACGTWVYVVVGFEGEIWCIRCNTPLNQNARDYDDALSTEATKPAGSIGPRFAAVVFGQPRIFTVADDQSGVGRFRVRVLDVQGGQSMTVPPQHLHRVA